MVTTTPAADRLMSPRSSWTSSERRNAPAKRFIAPPGQRGRKCSHDASEVFGHEGSLGCWSGAIGSAYAGEHRSNRRMTAVETVSRRPVCRRNRSQSAVKGDDLESLGAIGEVGPHCRWLSR